MHLGMIFYEEVIKGGQFDAANWVPLLNIKDRPPLKCCSPKNWNTLPKPYTAFCALYRWQGKGNNYWFFPIFKWNGLNWHLTWHRNRHRARALTIAWHYSIKQYFSFVRPIFVLASWHWHLAWMRMALAEMVIDEWSVVTAHSHCSPTKSVTSHHQNIILKI